MARYNEILTGRFNRALQKFLSMKGDAVSPQLAGEIQPGLMFPVGAEWRYLEQWNLFSISGVATEVGGVTSAKFRLRNPANSNVVGVIFKIAVSSNNAAADLVFGTLGPIAGDLTTVLTGQRLDARTQVATGNLVPSTAASGGPDSPQIIREILQPNVNLDLIFTSLQEIPLLPGDGFGMSPNAFVAANQFNFTVMWRERFLEESERT